MACTNTFRTAATTAWVKGDELVAIVRRPLESNANRALVCNMDAWNGLCCESGPIDVVEITFSTVYAESAS